MKNIIKLFVIAAIVALTSFGLASTGANAKSSNCDAHGIGNRTMTNSTNNSAYKISGDNATVTFNVVGKNCNLPVTVVVWQAPNGTTGKPYSAQKLYSHKTGYFKTGRHSMTFKLPNCYFQVDTVTGTKLTGSTNQAYNYDSRQVAFMHGGKKSCTPPPAPKPSASCKLLTIDKLDRTNFRFNGQAAVANGAKVSGYTFNVYNSAGTLVDTKTVATTALSTSVSYMNDVAGSYTVKLVAKTSLGNKTGASCEKAFTVTPEDKPGVSIIKLVDGVDYKKVGVNVEFTYQIEVTNTGNTDLNNVEVTDTPEAGVTLLNASQGTVTNNKWTYTIPSLMKGESANFTITAKVPVYKAGKIVNTVCVDAPTVPGTPDDCDDATVEVPPKTPETPETPETPVVETPEALPQTGPADALLKLFGAASLAGASVYYIASRRQ